MQIRFLLAASLLVAASASQAVVTNVAQFRLGEADAGAVAGGAGNAQTTNSTSSLHLPKIGAPVYSANVPPGILSNLSMSFDGNAQRYGSSTVATSVTDNFGIEAWVNPAATTATNTVIAYNGHSGLNGFGIFRVNNQWSGLFGGVAFFGGAQPVVLNTWTHLAVVRASGVATLYVNGVAAGTTTGAPNPAATATHGGMLIGGNSVPSVPLEHLNGMIDEVRVFTFAPGAFQVSDLNLRGVDTTPSNVPAGNIYGWLVLVLSMLVLAGSTLYLRTRNS